MGVRDDLTCFKRSVHIQVSRATQRRLQRNQSMFDCEACLVDGSVLRSASFFEVIESAEEQSQLQTVVFEQVIINPQKNNLQGT